MRKLAVVASAMGIWLSGCATVGNAVIGERDLQVKAAFALNTTPDKVAISERQADVQSIHFVASVGRKSYQCYITSVFGLANSDAICSGSNSTHASPQTQCNALLQAAGRC